VITSTRDRLSPPDDVQAEIEHLSRMAAVVLNEHANDRGLCAVCGSAFPCQSAVLAEHNVGLL